ncbi:adenosylcobinamide-phosphate synthase CbiB [uncultured Hoeflea sp.]|uniref:adenosylcobinamide-phosphate synthase CbiB n=1 Tax=uncultured Hoeflea sp. TaxID=538666 RepID=UPI00260FE81E|nr:adenosylcobinamide-phosphate synthase CbiB [uncultured Hoeflea sp.]
MTGHLPVLFAALLLDRFIGDPDWLWRRISHPVVLFGHAIAWADRRFNRDTDGAAQRRRNGKIILIVLLTLTVLGGWALSAALARIGIIGLVLEVVVVAIFLAQKSLADHVSAVARGLRDDGLAGGRRAVAMIVGRDPETLDESGVARAAIESLAENFSDGVVAPAFWYAVLGLPGLMAYKMLNTADSMIGHLNERYREFGRAAAKLDDLANWPAARLAALLMVVAAWAAKDGVAMRRAANAALCDSGLHRSPNAGWPEAAMAGALNLALAGPRRYGGDLVMEARLHASGREMAGATEIDDGVKVFFRACDGLAVVTVMLAILS